MDNERSNYLGIDLFAGAGGLTLGARLAGINVMYAVENDIHASKTYILNNPSTKTIVRDIKYVTSDDFLLRDNSKVILFGGPPCQGFSTSNQKTRSKTNPKNWLFLEFLRVVKMLMPEWILFENVKGIIETERGLFKNYLLGELEKLGYSCTQIILCASEFGVPQIRYRFFIVGSLNGCKIIIENKKKAKYVTVGEAIGDLPNINNGASIDYLPYPEIPNICSYAKKMRNNQRGCTGNLVSRNSQLIIDRYSYIPQGGNWENIPEELMTNYCDKSRCHTNIYRRLESDKPSVVLGNYRKAMLIHPFENRGLSIREAARLQSFPDWYRFTGSIGFQQQQVSDSVPPLLAEFVFKQIIKADSLNE